MSQTEKQQCQNKNMEVIERPNHYVFENDEYYICHKAQHKMMAPRFPFNFKDEEYKNKLRQQRKDDMCFDCIKCYSKEEQKKILTDKYYTQKGEIWCEAELRAAELTEIYNAQIAELEKESK
jgi:Zn-finger protein